MLVERLRSELMLKAHLKALRTALQLQLQETKSRQTEELDKRIHQNTLLSSDKNQKYDERLEHVKHTIVYFVLLNTRRLSSITNKSLICFLYPWYRQQTQTKTTLQKKEEEEEAECKKKFGAVPVPGHVIQPIYQEMMEVRENERKQGHEQRKEFLLSIQKPFSFEERDKNKKNIPQKHEGFKTAERWVFFFTGLYCFKVHTDNLCLISVHIKDQQEVCRNVQLQIASTQQNPAQAGCPKVRSADHTLGFLDEEPTFKPKIIPDVPDFKSLHKALQREALEKKQSQDVTRCQPFFLRTSALPARKYKKPPETSQVKVSKMNNLGRSKSLGALTLTSTDTLPTYITDAVRQRCVAIRKSMEIRESKSQESAEWLKSYQMRSQAMKKTVLLHAKLLDPHSSLKDVCNGNVQRHREADLQRMKDYMRELRDMKARVRERPYLFEQVKQKNAKTRAEQTFRRKLEKTGIKEQFVEETGESFRFDDTDTSSEKEIQSSRQRIEEENVEDGKKIEDVEDKSVKSKGEEMP
uniref:FAM161 centrosomal protein B n=1 Tax=Poecilia formosa TaxID=48698 RepID=A0A096M0X2_POEFO